MEIIDNALCTGCTACTSKCPVSCIRIKKNEDGFLFPSKGNECIGCNACYASCPRLSGVRLKTREQEAYAAVIQDKELWEKSSSGGAFLGICQAWTQGKTFYCGAAWDGLDVKHYCVDSIKEAQAFCKSKYLASDIRGVFEEIKERLDAGERGAFFGTPCQVAGLRSFLGKEYPSLLLVDLICHGVGSPAVFQTCMQLLESQFGKKIVSFSFRVKQKVYDQDHIERIKFFDGKQILIQNDPYIQLFKAQHCLRESCGENCIYRDSNRQGDITIGDFKHLKDVFPQLAGEKKNYSTVVLNTNKGRALRNELSQKMEMIPCDISIIKKYNPLFCRQTYFSKDRDMFFEEYHTNPQKAVDSWTTPVIIYRQSFVRKIYDSLPRNARRLIINRWKSEKV